MSAHRTSVRVLTPDSGRASAWSSSGVGAEVAETVRLEPRGVGQILDTAFDVYVARFGYLFSASLLVLMPVSIVTDLILRTDMDFTAIFLLSALAIPSNVLIVGLLAPVVVAHLLGEELELGAVVRTALRRLLPLIAVVLMTTLITIPLACLCLLPMAVGMWLFSVAPTVLLVENLGPVEAMQRSVFLTRGWPGFGRWLGWFLVGTLLFSPATAATEALADPVTRAGLADWIHLRGDALGLVITILGAMFASLSTAYMSTCAAVYYLDCRVRKEGFDLEVQLLALRRARDGGGANVARGTA